MSGIFLKQIKTFKIIFLFFLFWGNLSVGYCETLINTVWGPQTVHHELLEHLIHSKTLQRLKHIDQSGCLTYFGYAPQFSRYEHSVGVLALLQKAKVSLKEQTTGLLHDVSHTAFSHVGDHLFYAHNQEKSYQDIIHLSFLNKMNIPDITKPYNILLNDLEPDLLIYRALERPLPELCADRIQYIIHTGVVFKKISKNTAKAMIADLDFQEGVWFFRSTKLAKTFGLLSLHFTKALWGSAWNAFFYEYFSEVLKKAVDLNMISIADVKYGTDLDIMNKLKSSQDVFIQNSLKNLYKIHKSFKVTAYNQGVMNMKPKFRGVDPLVKVDVRLIKLTALDKDYKLRFDQTKNWCQTGYGIKPLVAYKADLPVIFQNASSLDALTRYPHVH